jgi:hypothetical protein
VQFFVLAPRHFIYIVGVVAKLLFYRCPITAGWMEPVMGRNKYAYFTGKALVTGTLPPALNDRLLFHD